MTTPKKKSEPAETAGTVLLGPDGAWRAGTLGAQSNAGSYLLQDAAGTQIGAMFCMKSSGTKYLEYYGLTVLLGGVGTPDGTIVFKLVWKDAFFADLAAFQAYCTTKGYGLHILATCVSGAW